MCAAIAKVASSRVEEEIFGEMATRLKGDRPDYSVNDPLGRISGYTDYSQKEMVAFTSMKQKLQKVYEANGFAPVELRPVEYAENLLKKGGLDKQIYGVARLQDGSVTKLGIPFDRTVPLTLFIASKGKKLTFPYKRYDIGTAFRGEKATKGRYRAFYQADVDIISKNISYKADAEVIATIVMGLKAMGVHNPKVFVNHITIAKALVAQAGIEDKDFQTVLRVLDKLKPDNRKDVIKEMREKLPYVTEQKAGELLDSLNFRGHIGKFTKGSELKGEAKEAYQTLLKVERVCSNLGVAKGSLQLSTNLARGLDYYTGIVFETFIPGQEKLGSVASGGRYSNLVGDFNPNFSDLEGVGGSIGLTRLFDVMKALNLVELKKSTSAELFVGYRTENEFGKACEIATSLREQGFKVELYTQDKLKLKHQFKVPDRKGIPYAVMVMNDSQNTKEIVVKDLSTKGQKKFTNASEMIEYLTELRSKDQLKSTIAKLEKDESEEKKEHSN